jgi:FkbM family methyltransferase
MINEIFNESVKKWFNDKGDVYKRLDYPELNEKSVVFDVGGYLGTFTESIYTRYGSNVHLFEPVGEFHKACDFKFGHIPKIRSHKYGLSKDNIISSIYISEDASSITPIDDANKEAIVLRNISDVIKELNIDSIDLIKINIEGEEYNLLERLVSDSELICKVKNIQVQYHTFISGAEERRERINELLKNTHECTWCYDWVWENWKLK